MFLSIAREPKAFSFKIFHFFIYDLGKMRTGERSWKIEVRSWKMGPNAKQEIEEIDALHAKQEIDALDALRDKHAKHAERASGVSALGGKVAVMKKESVRMVQRLRGSQGSTKAAAPQANRLTRARKFYGLVKSDRCLRDWRRLEGRIYPKCLLGFLGCLQCFRERHERFNSFTNSQLRFRFFKFFNFQLKGVSENCDMETGTMPVLPPGLPGEGDEVALEAGGLFREFQLAVDLVEVAADTHEDAASADGGEEFVLQAVVAAHQILDAIGFGEEFAVVKGVDVYLAGCGLVAADEMARQTDSDHRQLEAAGEQEVEEREVDGIAFAAVDDAVKIAVLRVVVVFLVAGEAEFVEEVVVDRGEDFLAGFGGVDSFAKFDGEIVEQRAIGFDVDVRILREAEEPNTFFDVEFLAVLEAKSQEPSVGFLAIKVPDDFPRAAAQERVAAQTMRAKPFTGFFAKGQDFVADGAVNGGVVIAEEVDESFSLAFRKLFGRRDCV